MQIKTNFSNNTIPDQYGCNVASDNLNHGINQTSFPFTVTDLPKDSRYLSWTLIDYDTIPIFGFAWIHWSVTDYPVTSDNLTIESNFSQLATIPQGRNSLDSLIQDLREPLWKGRKFRQSLTTHYSGPRPKDGIHHYRLSVYAMNSALNLEAGFGLNELMNRIDNVTIAETSQNLFYERRP